MFGLTTALGLTSNAIQLLTAALPTARLAATITAGQALAIQDGQSTAIKSGQDTQSIAIKHSETTTRTHKAIVTLARTRREPFPDPWPRTDPRLPAGYFKRPPLQPPDILPKPSPVTTSAPDRVHREPSRAMWIRTEYTLSDTLRVVGHSLHDPMVSLAQLGHDLHYAAHQEDLSVGQRAAIDAAATALDQIAGLDPRARAIHSVGGLFKLAGDALDRHPVTREQAHQAVLDSDLRGLKHPESSALGRRPQAKKTATGTNGAKKDSRAPQTGMRWRPKWGAGRANQPHKKGTASHGRDAVARPAGRGGQKPGGQKPAPVARPRLEVIYVGQRANSMGVPLIREGVAAWRTVSLENYSVSPYGPLSPPDARGFRVTHDTVPYTDSHGVGVPSKAVPYILINGQICAVRSNAFGEIVVYRERDAHSESAPELPLVPVEYNGDTWSIRQPKPAAAPSTSSAGTRTASASHGKPGSSGLIVVEGQLMPILRRGIIREELIKFHATSPPARRLPAADADGVIRFRDACYVMGGEGYYEVTPSAAADTWQLVKSHMADGSGKMRLRFDRELGRWSAYDYHGIEAGGRNDEAVAGPSRPGASAAGIRASPRISILAPLRRRAFSGLTRRGEGTRDGEDVSFTTARDSVERFGIDAATFPFFMRREPLLRQVRAAYKQLGELKLTRSNRRDLRPRANGTIGPAREAVWRKLGRQALQTSSIIAVHENTARETAAFYRSKPGWEAFCQENSEILYHYLVNQGVPKERLRIIDFEGKNDGHVAVLYAENMQEFERLDRVTQWNAGRQRYEWQDSEVTSTEFAYRLFTERDSVLLLNPWGQEKIIDFSTAASAQEVFARLAPSIRESYILVGEYGKHYYPGDGERVREHSYTVTVDRRGRRGPRLRPKRTTG